MKRDQLGVALLSGLCVLVLTTGVRADQEDDKKKADREWREAEEGQGKKKAGGQQGPGGVPGLEDNPLDKILELMRGVEDRLFESDTGDFTQEEQRRIVEAMRFEDKTSQALEELIRKIEEQMQNQQSSSGGGGSDQQQQQQKQQQQQNQSETPEQKRQREEREKREEEQRRMQQQNQPQQQQQNTPQNQQEQRAQQERREGQRPEDPSSADPRDPGAAGRWGQLPAKLHQDAQNAQNQEPPARWSELIKRYRERVAGAGSGD